MSVPGPGGAARFALGLAVLGLVFACSRSEPRADRPGAGADPRALARAAVTAKSPPPLDPPGDAERGKALVTQHECNRCHAGTEDPAPRLELDCTGCHQQILAGSFPASKDKLGRWREHVVLVRAVPSLRAVDQRLSRGWIRDFLLAPSDVRPLLQPTMPRLGLSAADARDIATYLTSRAAPASSADALAGADASRGRRLLEQRACGSCHHFSGVSPLPHAPAAERAASQDALLLAPDLRHARERFRAPALVRWLQDPKGVKPDTLMPATGFDARDARDVASYLISTPLAAAPPRAARKRLPPLEREVTFAEVDEQVFRRTCRHCHSDPNVSRGEGGPGNTGGFGFRGLGLDFSSYRALMAGYRGADGERRSVFEPGPDGTPRLVAALLARHDEEGGRYSDALRGMPLGMPALSAEQIQLVDTWIAQGRRR